MRLQRDGQTDFSKGMRFDGDVRPEDPSEAALIQNFRVRTSGDVVLRPGSQKMTTATFGASTVQGVYRWRPSALADKLAVVHNAHLQTSPSFSPYPLTFTDQGVICGTGNSAVGMVGFRDGSGEVLYVADGLGPINKYNGAAITLAIAGTPSTVQLVVYNRRLFGFNGSTLYWSALDNGDTLGVTASGGGSAVIRTFSGGDISGLAVVGSTLFIFHKNNISRFTGWTQDDIDISSGLSAVSHPAGMSDWKQAATYDGYVYFAGSDGVYYRMNEAGVVTSISDRIQSYVSGTAAGLVVPNHQNREVWFIGVTQLLVFNSDLDAWYIFVHSWANVNSFAMCAYHLTGVGDSRILVGGFDGFLRDTDYTGKPFDDVAADGTGGTAVGGIVMTRPIEFNDASAIKALRWGYLGTDFNQSQFTINVVDDGGSLTSFGVVTMAPGVSRFPVSGRHRSPRLYVTMTGSGTTFPNISDLWLAGFVYNRPV